MIGSRSRDPFDHVYGDDPALDKDSPAFDPQKYFQTFDPKYQPIRDGRTPTRFKIRPLSRKRYIAIAAMPPNERANAAVSYGVIGIENFRLASGSMLVPEFGGMGSDTHLLPPTLDLLFDAGLFGELMTVIMTASGLDPFSDGH
jgi:hypothetical protein